MGAFHLSLEHLVNSVADVIVIKTGLVISNERLIKLLQEEFPTEEIFKDYANNKERWCRIRSEEYDDYCRKIRKRLGELENTSPLFLQDVEKFMEWDRQGYDYAAITKRIFQLMSEAYDPDHPTYIDPQPIYNQIVKEYSVPVELILSIFDNLVHNQKVSNVITPVEQILWDGGVELEKLFKTEHIPLKPDEFIDQKFINYLQANPGDLEAINWRNFERLTAEFFKREGYEIELGPGSNDGGVDIRVYSKNDRTKPYIIIQCKRYKRSQEVKIETVKSLYTDVDFEKSAKGMIATTSKIAPGGKKLVSIRKYPLEFAENEQVKNWVDKMAKR